MADMRVFPNVNSPIQQSADTGVPLGLRGTRDGAAIFKTWQQSMIDGGYGFLVEVGSFSTPIVGGGNGTIVDLDQPEFIISVPTGKAILPFRVAIQCQVPLLATDADEAEAILIVDRTAAAVDDGTKTAESAFNLRTDNPRSSGCVSTSAYTADVTDPVHSFALGHKVIVGDVQGTPATALWTPLELIYEPVTVPILMGPCMLVGYWGGTVAVTGFAQVQWIELPSTYFS